MLPVQSVCNLFVCSSASVLRLLPSWLLYCMSAHCLINALHCRKSLDINTDFFDVDLTVETEEVSLDEGAYFIGAWVLKHYDRSCSKNIAAIYYWNNETTLGYLNSYANAKWQPKILHSYLYTICHTLISFTISPASDICLLYILHHARFHPSCPCSAFHPLIRLYPFAAGNNG